MKGGVPFAQVFELPGQLADYERMAFSIVLSEFEGHEFDWSTWQFKEKKND